MLAHTVDELLTQFHDNQSAWIMRLATGLTDPPAPHPRVRQIRDTAAMRPGVAGVIMLPMEGVLNLDLADHDEALAWLRQSRARDVLTWSMQPNPAMDLALLARGYRVGFEPWWMTRDLAEPITDPVHAVRMVTRNDVNTLMKSDVPYVIRDQVAANWSLVNHDDAQVMWLVAIEANEPVGHAIINMVGTHAGLFNVGVSGQSRNRGIGTSLTNAAMLAARERGALTMNLNSTPAGKVMYERTGFRQFGTGQTWTKSDEAVQHTPSRQEQDLFMAIGQGDVGAARLDPLLHAYLSNGMTPQEVAARFGQQEMLRHIIEYGGFVPDIISLWQAGMRDEAIAATRNPHAREYISGSTRAYPIHHAIERGAGTLVQALIAAGANLTARDGEYNATPLDWAHACNKPTIARIIRHAGGR